MRPRSLLLLVADRVLLALPCVSEGAVKRVLRMRIIRTNSPEMMQCRPCSMGRTPQHSVLLRSKAVNAAKIVQLALYSRSELPPASAAQAGLAAAQMQQPMQTWPGPRAQERGPAATQAGRDNTGLCRHGPG